MIILIFIYFLYMLIMKDENVLIISELNNTFNKILKNENL